jgi:hypothetical protein
METPNLLIVCIASFAAVLFILSFLSIVMHFLLVIFPVKPKVEEDTAIVAAITTAFNRQFPGTRITNIGEEK